MREPLALPIHDATHWSLALRQAGPLRVFTRQCHVTILRLTLIEFLYEWQARPGHRAPTIEQAAEENPRG